MTVQREKLFSETFIYRSVHLLLGNVICLLLYGSRRHQAYMRPAKKSRNRNLLNINFHLKSPALQNKSDIQCINFSKSLSIWSQHILTTCISMYNCKRIEKALRPLKHKQQQQKSHLFLLPGVWIMSYKVSFEISCGDLLGPSWLITAR